MHREHAVRIIKGQNYATLYPHLPIHLLVPQKVGIMDSLYVGPCARLWNEVEQDAEGTCSHRVTT